MFLRVTTDPCHPLGKKSDIEDELFFKDKACSK